MMHNQIVSCLKSKKDCSHCLDRNQNCPLEEKIFQFMEENSFSNPIYENYNLIKLKFADYKNSGDYSASIILSENKRY